MERRWLNVNIYTECLQPDPLSPITVGKKWLSHLQAWQSNIKCSPRSLAIINKWLPIKQLLWHKGSFLCRCSCQSCCMTRISQEEDFPGWVAELVLMEEIEPVKELWWFISSLLSVWSLSLGTWTWRHCCYTKKHLQELQVAWNRKNGNTAGWHCCQQSWWVLRLAPQIQLSHTIWTDDTESCQYQRIRVII